MGRTKGARAANHNQGKKVKVRRKTKDLDQIWSESQPDKIERTMREMTQYDEDKPGLGQFYCISCAKYFVSDDSLQEHFKTKRHKKRLKELKEKPWTTEEALLMKVDNGKKIQKEEPQVTQEDGDLQMG